VRYAWLERILKPKPVDPKVLIRIAVIMTICGTLGFIFGYYVGTGLFPQFTPAESIAPPESARVNLAEVQVLLDDSPIGEKEYTRGYNCVEFAWDAMRILSWEGQPAAIVALELNPGPNHAILLVPTKDEGWIFIDPQINAVVKPCVGGLYSGKKVVAMRVMQLTWIPLDEFIEDPVFEVMN